MNGYFIIIDGRQAGPYPKEVLKIQGISPDTFVWREGMDAWMKASDLPELADLFMADSAFGAYTQPEQPASEPPRYDGQPYESGRQPYGSAQSYGQPYYGQPYYGQNRGYVPPAMQKPHTNWLPWAIVTTVLHSLSFNVIGLVFGIIAIVQANKANSLYEQGCDDMADSANSSAKTMSIISIVLAGLVILFWVGIIILGIAGAIGSAELLSELYNL